MLWKNFFLCILLHIVIGKKIFQFCHTKQKNRSMFLAIPSFLNCSRTQESPIESKRVSIYSRSYYEINGVSCSAVNRTICTNAFLRISLRITSDETKAVSVSEKDCRILHEKHNIRGIKLHRITNNIWSSNKPTQYSYGWLGTKCNSIVNYRVEYGPIHFFDGLSSTVGCVLEKGVCFTPTETILWDKENLREKCPYKYIGSYIAYFTQNMVTINDLQSVFLISNFSENLDISQCGFSKPIFTENDIVLDLSPPNKDDSFNRIKNPINGKALFVEKIDTEIIKKDEENPKFQYLWNMIHERENEWRKQWLYRLCVENNNILTIIRWISNFEPTAGARILLGRDDIRAENIGNLLKIYPCHQIKVDRVFENHKVGNKCYRDLPIKVGKVILFAQPHSRDLKVSSELIDCEELAVKEVAKIKGIFDDNLGIDMEKTRKIIFQAHRLPRVSDDYVYKTLEKLHRQTESHRKVDNPENESIAKELSDKIENAPFAITVDKATNEIQGELNKIIEKWVRNIIYIIFGIVIIFFIFILVKIYVCIKCMSNCCPKQKRKSKVKFLKVIEQNGEMLKVLIEEKSKKNSSCDTKNSKLR